MVTERKHIDAVAIMRKSRDRLRRRFKGMTFAEQKRAMEMRAKRRSEAVISPKRHTA